MATNSALNSPLKNPLIGPVLKILKATPSGLSEYQLLSQLRQQGFELSQAEIHSADLDLFRQHFLIMNALYQLQDLMINEGCSLQISALKIQLSEANLFAADDKQQIICNCDDQHLKDYYLDWSEFENSCDDSVQTLLDDFWKRYASYITTDITTDTLYDAQRQQALRTLDLSEDYDEATIKRHYMRLVSHHHPDKGGDAANFCKIRQAYELLMLAP